MPGGSLPNGSDADMSASQSGSDSVGIELRDVLAFARRRYPVVLIAALVALIGTFFVTTQLTPRYTATAVVLLDQQSNQVVNIDAVLSGIGSGLNNANSQTAILTSRKIAERVATEADLWSDPEFRDPGPSKLAWMVPTNWFRSSDERLNAGGEQGAHRQREFTIEAVRDRMTIVPRPLTQTIEISFESHDAARAAEIANTIADQYALDQLEAKFEATKSASDWLSRRLEGMQAQLDAAERAVEIFRAENNLIDADGLLLSEQELSELNSQLILIRAERAEKEAIYARARQLLVGGTSQESVPEVLNSPVISALRQQQAELARKQADLTSRYGARHPQMINVRAERRDLDAQIQQEIARIVDGLKNALEVVRTRERSMEESLSERRDFASGNNQSLVQLRALEREAEATRALYETFLARFKEVNEQETLQTSGIRVISPAVPAFVPSFPRTSLFLAGGLFFGLVIGVALAVALELFDDTFRTASRREQMLGVPNITAVPLLDLGKSGGTAPDYALHNPLTPYAEAFRSLRTSLELSNVDTPPKVILFTSAVPSEGKTTVATCFALTAARSGVKTVIVDCDLRKPRLLKLLDGEPVEMGLVQHLSNQASLDQVTLNHAGSGADFIPTKVGIWTPNNIFGSKNFATFLDELKATYDLVVLDSAPLLPVADTRTIASLVDTTVLVVRWGVTPRAAVVTAANLLNREGQRVAGTVLSAVDMKRQAAYGYGDSVYVYGNYGGYYSA